MIKAAAAIFIDIGLIEFSAFLLTNKTPEHRFAVVLDIGDNLWGAYRITLPKVKFIFH
ncbi:hypothetical protein [methanotrophic endosymbiont of Bathymodiolus puteoserpentis (Logatchev)]|jgi:uncharacterized membrane protein|uniref:hypothetical protein n=1 Tax=methanotrophic endosymbiont of Bathymodiolus puteoserpentis (Logatchev) TaxID=343235 RepID=UPI001C2DC6CB|nr:hypothetical protein [methanotrophic endosymbiont of Bathymodiolus puteoserpentis (Logatchev)]